MTPFLKLMDKKIITILRTQRCSSGPLFNCSIDQLKDDDESTTDRWKLLKAIPEDIALTCVRCVHVTSTFSFFLFTKFMVNFYDMLLHTYPPQKVKVSVAPH